MTLPLGYTFAVYIADVAPTAIVRPAIGVGMPMR
jgi:hypothetical protein